MLSCPMVPPGSTLALRSTYKKGGLPRHIEQQMIMRAGTLSRLVRCGRPNTCKSSNQDETVTRNLCILNQGIAKMTGRKSVPKLQAAAFVTDVLEVLDAGTDDSRTDNGLIKGVFEKHRVLLRNEVASSDGVSTQLSADVRFPINPTKGSMCAF